MKREEIELYAKDVPEWRVSADGKKITRTFEFKDFKGAMAFANAIAMIAEEQGHHPDLLVKYGEVTAELSTHTVGGLTANDFIMAAKIDKI